MPEGATSLSLKCKVCGGDIRNDYLGAACVCAHCGNKWAMRELVPEYEQHTRAIEHLTKAKEILAGKPDIAGASQARLLYKMALVDCTEHPDAISADLTRLCNEGMETAKKFEIYARGMNYLDKKNPRQALAQFKKIPGYRDVDELLPACEKEAIAARKRHIPFAIIIGMVLPAIIAIVLHEKLGLPLAVCIPAFVVLTAAATYAVYLEGTLATVIMVLSFISAVPLIIFMVLAYGFGVPPATAAICAVGIPILIIVGVAFMPERS